MASSQCQRLLAYHPSKARGIHRVFYKRYRHTSTHAQLGLIKYTRPIRSIALSPDDRFLAASGEDGKITHQNLSRVIVSVVFLWITTYLNNYLVLLVFQIAFKPCVSSTPHFPGACHSDRRRCARFMKRTLSESRSGSHSRAGTPAEGMEELGKMEGASVVTPLMLVQLLTRMREDEPMDDLLLWTRGWSGHRRRGKTEHAGS